MSPSDVFGLVGTPALLGWAILIFGPRRFELLNALPQLLIPFGLAVIYAALVLTHFAEAGGGYGSLAAVRLLFSSDWVLLAGWVHYLAFDLLVGAYLAARMDRAGIGRLLQAPILATTFLFGPAGLALGLGLEATLRLRPSRVMPLRLEPRA